MYKTFCLVSLLLAVQNLYSQYFVLEETNATYAYFGDQERLIERLFRKALIHPDINLSKNSHLRRSNLINSTDLVRGKLFDCFSSYYFRSLYLENSLENYPLESRKTYFYLQSNSSISYLLQTRIIFEGIDIEKEKFEPKILDILILTEGNIIRLDKRSLEMAFNPEIDEELEALIESMPPLPIQSSPMIGFSPSFQLKERDFNNEISLLIPNELKYLSKEIDENNGIFYFEHNDELTSFEIRKVTKGLFNKQKKRINSASYLSDIKVFSDSSIYRGNTKISIIEANYFHWKKEDREAWTKLFIENHDVFWTVTIRYPYEDRSKTNQIRKKIIDSIKIK